MGVYGPIPLFCYFVDQEKMRQASDFPCRDHYFGEIPLVL